MPLKIRPLCETDVEVVVEIAHQSQQNSWSYDVFKDCMKADYANYVLESDGVVVGFWVALLQGLECQLMNIGVAKACRRRGYGAQLLDHLLRHCKSSCCRRIILEVRASNTPAIQLYQSRGFREIGIRKRYYPTQGGREDAVVYFLEF